MKTYLTCLTPPGTAALGVLALNGPDGWSILHGLFLPNLPEQPEIGTFRLGRIGDELGRDEIVLAVKPAANGPIFEIQCHGGQQVLLWLQEILQVRGAVICSWPDFHLRCGLPAWQVQAIESLALAPTVRTAAILLDQFHGAFANALAQITDDLHRGRVDEARRQLEAIRKRIPLGRHLVEPWRIVIGGAVNVGKSSLVNVLAGHTRSVVSPSPGTTRDLVTTRLALDGWPVEATDTAGWRSGTKMLEAAGIARAQAALAQADLCVWVLDGSTAPFFPQQPLPRTITVINKIDLPAAWDFQSVVEAWHVSAQSGSGIAALCQHLANLLVPEPLAAREPVPFTRNAIALVERIHDLLEQQQIEAAIHLLDGLAPSPALN